MNRQLGLTSSLITLLSVILFAVFMLLDWSNAAYSICILLAVGYLMMVASYSSYSTRDNEAAKITGLIFAVIYALLIMIVYYAQITTVAQNNTIEPIIQLLDYQQFGLLFNYNLFGYGMLSVSTFFIGFTISTNHKEDILLKRLLHLHGVFTIVVIIPILNLFNAQMSDSAFIGIAVLIAWCIYFAPICFLSYRYFKRKED